ncbi:hypothetical protein ScPMuIL_007207 [Solemya velum]
MRLTEFFLVLLAVTTGMGNKLDLFEIVEDIDGKPVHEVVSADENQGYIVEAMTDVSQGGIQYESIVLYQNFQEGHFVFWVARSNEKTCYVGQREVLSLDSFQEAISKLRDETV